MEGAVDRIVKKFDDIEDRQQRWIKGERNLDVVLILEDLSWLLGYARQEL